MKNTLNDLGPHVAAGFPLLWVHTREPHEAEAAIVAMCAKKKWPLGAWDCVRGYFDPVTQEASGNHKDALSAVTNIPMGSKDRPQLVILHNYNRFLSTPVTLQAIYNAAIEAKANHTTMVILAGTSQVPGDIEPICTLLDHPLPTALERIHIAAEMILQQPDGGSTTGEMELASEASAGMTRMQTENSYALSLTTQSKLDPKLIYASKADALEKTGFLRVYSGKEDLALLRGMGGLQTFALRSIERLGKTKFQAKGILLLGVPGTGKSHTAKAIGKAAGLETIVFNPSDCKGSLVGQTETNMRLALQTIKQFGKCVVFLDELEKSFAGVSSSDKVDGGTTAGSFGDFLKFMDGQRDCYVIATCNKIESMPPELKRAGRFDACFFTDLPTRDERNQIWDAHCQRVFGKGMSDLDEDTADLDNIDQDWTGAEIAACCEMAENQGISLLEAAGYITPICRIDREPIDALRTYADGRCISSSTGKLFRSQRAAPTTAARRRTTASQGVSV